MATIMDDMDGTNSLPNDLSECHELLLAAYSGYLHADAYTGYDAIFLAPGSGIIEVQ